MARVKVTAVGVPNEARSSKKLEDMLAECEEQNSVIETLLAPAKVLSTLDHNVLVPYNGQAMAVPPRGEVFVANKEKLGRLPSGIIVVAQPHLNAK